MLRKIEIQNYAIIDRLEMNFPQGLTIITGETGAGKSILLGALGLIMGKRADSKVLFDQDRKCFVEATFEISDYDLESFFVEEGLDYHEELLIRREIAPGGKSRAFVNDSPVTLDILATLADNLIDIHQQFDTLDIQKPGFQLQIIDALASAKGLMDAYTGNYRLYRNVLRNLEELKTKNRNATQEMEFLSFQMDEFNKAELKPGEQETLESELQRLTAAEDIKKISALIAHILQEDEHAVISSIQLLLGQMGTISSIDEACNDIANRLMAVKEELYDLAREAGKLSDITEYDEEAIHQTNNRLNLIYRLQKKHHVASLDDLLKIRDDIEMKINSFADLTREIAALETEKTKIENILNQLAIQLSEKRKSVIAPFEENIHDALADLSMTHAYIKVRMNTLNALGPTGIDDISILFAPNKGSDFLPLKDTASGGEMSRLTLCIKSLVAGELALPTLVFDEIDAGVSGEVAHKMGAILQRLSSKHQVICITHSPQIAAKAQSHIWVYKSDTDKRTVTAMRELSVDERITEIAMMLSGNPPSETAKANARELLGI